MINVRKSRLVAGATAMVISFIKLGNALWLMAMFITLLENGIDSLFLLSILTCALEVGAWLFLSKCLFKKKEGKALLIATGILFLIKIIFPIIFYILSTLLKDIGIEIFALYSRGAMLPIWFGIGAFLGDDFFLTNTYWIVQSIILIFVQLFVLLSVVSVENSKLKKIYFIMNKTRFLWVILVFAAFIMPSIALFSSPEYMMSSLIFGAIFGFDFFIGGYGTYIVFVFFAFSFLKWIFNKGKEIEIEEEPKYKASIGKYKASIGKYKASIGKLILLYIVTLGIWQYVLIAKTTKYCNKVKDMSVQSPTKKLLLCMFVPFYSIFWAYEQAQRLDRLTSQKGVTASNISVACLILAIFIPFVVFIILQDRINLLCDAKEMDMVKAEEPSVQPIVAAQTVVDEKPIVNDTINMETLKQLKELLDAGIITQEEFDAKKKQILGL